MRCHNLVGSLVLVVLTSACSKELREFHLGLGEDIHVDFKIAVCTRDIFEQTTPEVDGKRVGAKTTPTSCARFSFEKQIARDEFDPGEEDSERASVRVITDSGDVSCTAQVRVYRFDRTTVTFDQRSFETERGRCFFSIDLVPVSQVEVLQPDGTIRLQEFHGAEALWMFDPTLPTE